MAIELGEIWLFYFYFSIKSIIIIKFTYLFIKNESPRNLRLNIGQGRKDRRPSPHQRQVETRSLLQ